MTKIEYVDKSWNPITGCSPVSPGCRNCWAKKMATRLRGRHGYSLTNPFDITLHKDKLGVPLKWRKPARIDTCFMGDMFHDSVPFEWIDEVFAVMALCLQHTFLLLTKRLERMAKYFHDHATRAKWGNKAFKYANKRTDYIKGVDGVPDYGYDCDPGVSNRQYPLPNVWLGVSVENENYLDRVDGLIHIEGWFKWISFEPLLGAIPPFLTATAPGSATGGRYLAMADLIDWVVVGGESGSGARAMHPDWVRSIRDDCEDSETPFFFKQWGSHRPVGNYDENGKLIDFVGMERCDKKYAGHLLDGKEYLEIPDGPRGKPQSMILKGEHGPVFID